MDDAAEDHQAAGGHEGRGRAAVRRQAAVRGHDAASGVERLPEYAERVLELAELIPPGRVLTYGDVARLLREEQAERDGTPYIPGAPVPPGSGGPRQVGTVMARYGSAAPWWRVVRADGVLLPGSEQRALGHYRAEGTPLRAAAVHGAPPRLDLRRARWQGAHAGAPERGRR
ncbi:MGMT family protein [Streptomyces sp. JJ66]|uniref:MGMT family protein n=1 Tax=Streptomyces sp. JJ66 TaxID=2803843 RepID=UPI001C5676F5|nr:MGMT family protein [Streptomyces sp. JJ66]MBW1602981.1 MGMT family protein [Streptomyces sp. JJ66]